MRCLASQPNPSYSSRCSMRIATATAFSLVGGQCVGITGVFRCWIAPQSCLMETTNSPFFRSGEAGMLPLFYFSLFQWGGCTCKFDRRRPPLPPIEKLSTGKLPDTSYPQATVDSVDNFCKLLILLVFFWTLTNG